MAFKDFLYSDNIGKMPTDSSGNVVPALLFANSQTVGDFGDLYLFNNFGVSGSDTLTVSSDVSMHFVEDNSFINDHIALQPITYTLNGFVGEVIYRPTSKWSNWIQSRVTDYLKPLSIISPTVSSYVGTAINITNQIEENYRKFSQYAENIMKTINNWQGQITYQKSNQRQVFENLLTLRDNRILVDVYTPYKTLKNMAITSIVFSQTENTKYKANIQITLQEYREVGTKTRQATKDEVDTLLKSQSGEVENNGKAQKKKVKSTLRKIVEGGHQAGAW